MAAGRIADRSTKKELGAVSLPERLEVVNSAASGLAAGDGALLGRSSAAWGDLQTADDDAMSYP
jgi:hypothetical protein